MNFVFTSSLYTLLRLHSFDPTDLHCTLQDQTLSTAIHFTRDADQNLSGELDNYVLKSRNQKQFLSGDVFFDISFQANRISGHTGDPRGVVSNFSLTRRGSDSTGEWNYQCTDPDGEKTQALFDCVYDDDSN